VAGKDAARNVLLVVQGHDHPALFSRRLTAVEPHWVAGASPPVPLECMARCRHRQPLQPCHLEIMADGRLAVNFATPQRALTPGQFVVFYDGENCLGGATIATVDMPTTAGLPRSRPVSA